MSQSMKDFAATLELLEEEIGLEDLSQLLADMLLVCSTRVVGDVPTNWTVKTDIVNGEVTAISDAALSKVNVL
jgi:hypothetical protein